MGAHPDVQDGIAGWRFCVWAPEVAGVSVVGDFNGLNAGATPMEPVLSRTRWAGVRARPGTGRALQVRNLDRGRRGPLQGGPLCVLVRGRTGATASRLMDINGYSWQDSAWLADRSKTPHMERPLNIYEVHLGSWKRHGNEPQGEPREDGTWPGPMRPVPRAARHLLHLRRALRRARGIVRDMGYTHIEVLPHPGAPLRRLLGLPGHRVLRGDGALRRTQAAHAFRRCLPCRRHRRDHRLGAGRLLRRLPGARDVQRPYALRARDPSQLGYA